MRKKVEQHRSEGLLCCRSAGKGRHTPCPGSNPPHAPGQGRDTGPARGGSVPLLACFPGPDICGLWGSLKWVFEKEETYCPIRSTAHAGHAALSLPIRPPRPSVREGWMETEINLHMRPARPLVSRRGVHTGVSGRHRRGWHPDGTRPGPSPSVPPGPSPLLAGPGPGARRGLRAKQETWAPGEALSPLRAEAGSGP